VSPDNVLGPRETVVDRRRRESVERVRNSGRNGEPGEPARCCSQEGKCTATLPLERKRETGEGFVRNDPCEARRRSLLGLPLWMLLKSGCEKLELRFSAVGDGVVMTGSSERGATGQHGPLHCEGFIQSRWSVGWRGTTEDIRPAAGSDQVVSEQVDSRELVEAGVSSSRE
jgi:hypothetical protein